MSKRLGLAFVELGEAILELVDGTGAEAGSSSPVTASAAAFAGAQRQETKDPGNCPIHGYPFKTTKKDGTPVRPYCSSKMPDGSWCKERP